MRITAQNCIDLKPGQEVWTIDTITFKTQHLYFVSLDLDPDDPLPIFIGQGQAVNPDSVDLERKGYFTTEREAQDLLRVRVDELIKRLNANELRYNPLIMETTFNKLEKSAIELAIQEFSRSWGEEYRDEIVSIRQKLQSL